ncbi:MAG: hypothetical protein HZB42_06335 [Sphingobacteriales bacterium]|nr:hypothetical protein [Sphingobacteriales bacterium]
MNHPYYSDQAYIAESFNLEEDYIAQNARLAFFKINSYKLTLIKAAFLKSRRELQENINRSLFNYTCPAIILADLGFFKGEIDN